MRPLYRPQQKNTGRGRLLYLTILFLVIFLLDMASGGKIRTLAQVVNSGIYQSWTSAARNITESGFFATRHTLELENASLREALAQFQSRDSAYRAMEDENARLRAFTGLATVRHGVTVPIVSSIETSPYGTFIIAAGINDGIARDSVVYGDSGYAIGIVAESSAGTALVKQFFAPTVDTEAIIGDVALTLSGSGGGNAAGKAPRDAIIREGDIVRGKTVGAPIGVVGKIVSDVSSAYKQIYVRFPQNLSTMLFVYVERK